MKIIIIIIINCKVIGKNGLKKKKLTRVFLAVQIKDLLSPGSTIQLVGNCFSFLLSSQHLKPNLPPFSFLLRDCLVITQLGKNCNVM